MQGKHRYQERLFSTVVLSELVPKNHLLRKLDRTVELDFIYGLTESLYCSQNGRPSIDPVLFFRIQLIGFLYGIKSDRQLCEEIQLNLAYRWFCRLNLEDAVPDHSSLTKIRDRFGVETYRMIFENILAQLRSSGLLPGNRIIADASLIEADASFNSLEIREESDPSAKPLKPHQEQYNDFREGKKKRKISNQTHVSKTDPDATIVSRRGINRKLSYKAHYSIDASSRCIVDCHVTTGARHECTVLPERIEFLVENKGFEIQELIADKGYGRGPTYSFLREKNIRSYIPLHDKSLGQGKLSRGDFKYDRKNDRYLCQNNQYLYPYDKPERGTVNRYRVIGGHCKSCPLRKNCLPENQQSRARFVYRSHYQDEINRVRKRQKTAYFKSKLKERAWKVEGLFGEAKQNHCLRRAKYRGKDKMQIQLYMIAVTQNIKRLVELIFSAFLDLWDNILFLSKGLVRQEAF